YLDEIAEAREDVVVVLHPLSDHRRELFLDRRNETLRAPEGFMLVARMNPGYQRGFQAPTPSTRQRLVTGGLDSPRPPGGAELPRRECGVDDGVARRLVGLAGKIRKLEVAGLRATVSTRLLVHTAHLIAADLPPRTACRVGIVESLSDDPAVVAALTALANLAFGTSSSSTSTSGSSGGYGSATARSYSLLPSSRPKGSCSTTWSRGSRGSPPPSRRRPCGSRQRTTPAASAEACCACLAGWTASATARRTRRSTSSASRSTRPP